MQKDYVKTAWFSITNVIVTIAMILLVIGSLTWMVPAPITVPTAAEIAAEITIPEIGDVNLTGVKTGIADIQSTLDEDETWEDEAEALATEEWERRDYREIYKWIDYEYNNIDDREDIDYVRIKDTKFSGMDGDDEDATVEQLLKVRYEDSTVGIDFKIYLHVTTEIDEGEADIVDIVEVDKDFEL